VVACASGKGGTGKSFLATNLAIALHRSGLRVVVFDCDFGLGNAHLLFGVNPLRSAQHLLQGCCTPSEALTPTPYGPALVAGGSGISALAELRERHLVEFGRSMAWLAGHCDVLVLDCAAGLSPQSLLTVLVADHAILVTNPEIAALTDAYALIKCLGKQARRPTIHLVVNRVGEAGLGPPTFDRLAAVSRRFVGIAIHYAGEVAEDPAVSQRRLGQPPLIVSHPRCPTSQAVMGVVRHLERTLGGNWPRLLPAEEGVASRLLRALPRQ
jgi:flagellar biosynthesis protein FlhG